MKRMLTGIGLALLVAVGARVPVGAQDVAQKLAAAKQAAAANQKALRAYSWLEKTELSLKGEVKSTKVDMCRYGPDGKVQKSAVVTPPPPEQERGLKGKIVAKKTEDLREELESAVYLVQKYVPPHPDLMQVVINSGTASIAQAGPGAATLKFPGYVKAGDALMLTFELHRQVAAAYRRLDLAGQAGQPRVAGGDDVGPARRHQPSRGRDADHSGQQARGPDTEVNYQKLAQ